MIDWFTVGAQILNFLILVFLLKRFLYRPVLEAMAEREASIAAAKTDADARSRTAELEAGKLQGQQQELALAKEELLAGARREAEAGKQAELAKAREALAAQQARWAEAVALERAGFLREARARVAQQACAVARRLTSDLADADLEAHILRVFARRLAALPGPEREELARHVRDGGELVATTAFAPDAAAKEKVEEAARSALGSAGLRWERSPELVGGVVLTAGARRLSWSVSDYLDGLEERLAEVLATEGGDDGPKTDTAAAA